MFHFLSHNNFYPLHYFIHFLFPRFFMGGNLSERLAMIVTYFPSQTFALFIRRIMTYFLLWLVHVGSFLHAFSPKPSGFLLQCVSDGHLQFPKLKIV